MSPTKTVRSFVLFSSQIHLTSLFADIKMISRTSYNGFQYTHQGWLLEDGKHLFLDDELDEMQGTTLDNKDGVI
jgi:hypothetical protein